MPAHRPEYWGTYAKLEAAMGKDATAKLVEVFAGQRIWVPVPKETHSWRPQARRALIAVLGEESAQALFETYGGDYLNVPMGEKPYNLELKRLAAKLHRQGATVMEIVAATGRSRRTVFRWLSEPITNLTSLEHEPSR